MSSKTIYRITCEVCNKSFPSKRSLAGHRRMHSSSGGKIHVPKCCCLITRKEIAAYILFEFQDNIKFCKRCNNPLNSNRIFCNSSCAASHNNIERIKNGYTVTTQHKEKTSQTVRKTIEYRKSLEPKLPVIKPKLPITQAPIQVDPGVEFSKIFVRTCAHCKQKFCSRKITKYCSQCHYLYNDTQRNRFKFTFNVFHYPDLFDLDLIQSIGWYSRGGKAGKWNPNGLSRDHKVSVTDAIRNNYPPYYITHPCNCEIMSWTDNNKKKSKSSITFNELKVLVDEYDSHKRG